MYQDLTFRRASFASLLGPSLTGGIAAALAEETLRHAQAAADADAGRFLSSQLEDWRFAPANER